MKVTRTEHEFSKGLADADYFEVPEGFDIFGWSPLPPGTRNAAMTQVHVHFGRAPGRVFVLRFKGTNSLDALIDGLIDHRKAVFGERK